MFRNEVAGWAGQNNGEKIPFNFKLKPKYLEINGGFIEKSVPRTHTYTQFCVVLFSFVFWQGDRQ